MRGWYVAYKVVIALYFWSSLIWTWIATDNGAWYLIYMTNWGICTLNITILLDTSIVILKYVGVGVPDKLMTGKYSVTWKLSFILIDYFSELASLLHFLHCCSFHHFVILDNAL